MRIYPKLDSELAGYEKIKPYIKDMMEIQLLDYADEDILSVLTFYTQENPELKEVTLHTSAKTWQLDHYLYSKDRLSEIINFITRIGEYKKVLNIKINILWHLAQSYKDIQAQGGIENLNIIYRYLEKYDILMLLENVIDMNGALDDSEHVSNFVYEYNRPLVRMCFDICHLHCYLNKLKLPLSAYVNYVSREVLSHVVYQVHFSATWNNDGFRDLKGTHSKYHNQESLKEDILILQDLGISNTNIIVEVIEDDYNERECELKEFEVLTEGNYYVDR